MQSAGFFGPFLSKNNEFYFSPFTTTKLPNLLTQLNVEPPYFPIEEEMHFVSFSLHEILNYEDILS